MSKIKVKEYQPQIISFLVLNFLVMGIGEHLINITAFDYKDIVKSAQLPALTVILSYVLNGLIPSELKYKLVFLRWRDPLPATRLKRTIRSDSRFNEEQLTDCFGPIPNRPDEQNIFWYKKIYKPNQDTEKVRDVHRSFLLTRDLTAISSMFILAAIANTLFLSGSMWIILVVCAEFFIIRISAVNYGNRFVCTCIAEGIGATPKKSSIIF